MVKWRRAHGPQATQRGRRDACSERRRLPRRVIRTVSRQWSDEAWYRRTPVTAAIVFDDSGREERGSVPSSH